MTETPETPEPFEVDLLEDTGPIELPELPEGMHWEMSFTGTAEVIHPDGSKS